MRGRAIIVLGLAVVLAIAAVFLARNWIQEQARPIIVQQPAQPENTITVVVAKERMTFGNPVRKEQLRLVKWPGDAVPEGAFTTIEEVLGDKEERVVLRAIEVNEPVLKTKISGFGGKASLAATVSTRDLSVGEVNEPAQVAETPKKKVKKTVKITRKPKEDPLSAVRIVRGTNATNYEVQPDLQPLFGSVPAQKLTPSATATVAAPETEESKPVTPAGPTFVKPQTGGPETGTQNVPSVGGEQEDPINLLPPDLEAALN